MNNRIVAKELVKIAKSLTSASVKPFLYAEVELKPHNYSIEDFENVGTEISYNLLKKASASIRGKGDLQYNTGSSRIFVKNNKLYMKLSFRLTNCKEEDMDEVLSDLEDIGLKLQNR